MRDLDGIHVQKKNIVFNFEEALKASFEEGLKRPVTLIKIT